MRAKFLLTAFALILVLYLRACVDWGQLASPQDGDPNAEVPVTDPLPDNSSIELSPADDPTLE